MLQIMWSLQYSHQFETCLACTLSLHLAQLPFLQSNNTFPLIKRNGSCKLLFRVLMLFYRGIQSKNGSIRSNDRPDGENKREQQREDGTFRAKYVIHVRHYLIKYDCDDRRQKTEYANRCNS